MKIRLTNYSGDGLDPATRAIRDRAVREITGGMSTRQVASSKSRDKSVQRAKKIISLASTNAKRRADSKGWKSTIAKLYVKGAGTGRRAPGQAGRPNIKGTVKKYLGR